MRGAIAGDIIGSYYEFHKIKTKEFELFHPKSKFTDDTTLSMAVAKSILDNEPYDTMGAIAGGIAEAYYGIPKEIEDRVYGYLSEEFLDILKRFDFGV